MHGYFAFSNEKDIFVVVYLDDITIYSETDEHHLQHLRTVFQKCIKFGISLNPKKILFSMEEGKLLGHIIFKDGIRIDPSRIEAIQKLDYPRNKKEIQSFNGRINFLRRFIPNLAEHLRELTNMLKKTGQVKWTEEAKKSFHQVKFALSHALSLSAPIIQWISLFFHLLLKHTLVVVLMQKKDQKTEQPIAYFSRTIRDGALKYDIIEKQALALVKALKDFRVYILHSHVLVYVPNVVVKDVLTQNDPEGRRGKWIAAMLEYDLEIKPTKLVKGQGLAKLMADSNLHVLDINFMLRFQKNKKKLSIILRYLLFLLHHGGIPILSMFCSI
jgi:hypothetical protein